MTTEDFPTSEQWKKLSASLFRNAGTAATGTLVVTQLTVLFTGPDAEKALSALGVSVAVGVVSGVSKVVYNWFKSGYTEYGVGSDG